MRYWLDTEFLEDGQTIKLISLGIVAEDGREYYAERAEFQWAYATPWLRENVAPHLIGGEARRTTAQIKADVLAFVGVSDGKPEFWGYYADYDWVVFCWLFGRMIDLPKGWPMYCRDIKQWADELGGVRLPKQSGAEHNALADARWNKAAWTFLREIVPLGAAVENPLTGTAENRTPLTDPNSAAPESAVKG